MLGGEGGIVRRGKPLAGGRQMTQKRQQEQNSPGKERRQVNLAMG